MSTAWRVCRLSSVVCCAVRIVLCRLFIARFYVVRCLIVSLLVCCSLFVVCCLLFVDRLSFVVGWLLVAVCCLLFVVCYHARCSFSVVFFGATQC